MYSLFNMQKKLIENLEAMKSDFKPPDPSIEEAELSVINEENKP